MQVKRKKIFFILNPTKSTLFLKYFLKKIKIYLFFYRKKIKKYLLCFIFLLL